jgi:predicted porin
MGRTLTPSYYGVAAWELTGAANYSLVGKTYAWGGANSRNDSQFTYKTPNLNGFTVEAGYVTKADMKNFVSTSNGAKWDISAVYANGPIIASLVANKVQSAKTNWTLGGQYNFGNFIVAASYTDSYANGIYARRSGVTLGGTVRFGAFWVTADLGRDTKNQLVLGVNNKKYTNGLLEGKYALSKRTLIYAAYLRLDSTNNYGLGLRHDF